MSAPRRTLFHMSRPRDELTDDEVVMLTIEALWWQFAGLKEKAVRDKLDISMTTYYQRLNALIDTERAMDADPITVKRLQAKRAYGQIPRAVRLPA